MLTEEIVRSYAAVGLYLVPFRQNQKTPIARWKKGTVDLNWIVENLSNGINLGFATGERSSDICVLDFDYNAKTNLSRFQTLIPALQTCPTVQSGEGCHLYFRSRVRKSRVLAKTQQFTLGYENLIELKSNGSLILLPGSTHPNGQIYRWMNGCIETIPYLAPNDVQFALGLSSLFDDRVAPVKKNIKSFSLSNATRSYRRNYGLAALRSESDSLACTHKGGRNDRLNRAVFSLSRLQPAISAEEIYETLRAACLKNRLIADDGIHAFNRTFHSALRVKKGGI